MGRLLLGVRAVWPGMTRVPRVQLVLVLVLVLVLLLVTRPSMSTGTHLSTKFRLSSDTGGFTAAGGAQRSTYSRNELPRTTVLASLNASQLASSTFTYSRAGVCGM